MKKAMGFLLTIIALVLIAVSLVVITAPLTPNVHADKWLEGEFALSLPPWFCFCPSIHDSCPCPEPPP
jgi:hypothetical protein